MADYPEKNKEILAKRIILYDKIAKPRVGDWCKFSDGDMNRITHDWGDRIQTGGCGSGFYLGDGFISYSGGLDPGIDTKRFIDTGKTKDGIVWFFDGDISGAHRGVYFQIPFRIYEIKKEV